MNAARFTISSSPPPPYSLSQFSPLQISSSLLRPRKNTNKTKKKNSYSDQRLNLVIDVENITSRASDSLKRFYSTTESNFNRFILSGNEAFEDFKTLVTVDSNRRLIISCRRSSLWFMGNSLLWGFVIFLVVRGIMEKFGFLEYYHGGYGSGFFVSRRDRSLGGREVVVGKRKFKEREEKKKGFNFKVPNNPLSPPRDMGRMEDNGALALRPRKWLSREEELPNWWPGLVLTSSLPSTVKNNQELQKEANRVIRAIMDSRMCGKDITEDDICQFRRICKASGARVHFDTDNARDSFYRASVDFVLNSCSSSGRSTSFAQIDGEDARQFVAGLADNIGLENLRAARIVSAAVAARTRSWFLQAWALEMQGKRGEAVMELSKICLIHQVFPPKESSPEMEMVAQGLEKHLRVEQRKLLMNLLVETCGCPATSTAEALGLTSKSLVVDHHTWPPTL